MSEKDTMTLSFILGEGDAICQYLKVDYLKVFDGTVTKGIVSETMDCY